MCLFVSKTMIQLNENLEKEKSDWRTQKIFLQFLLHSPLFTADFQILFSALNLIFATAFLFLCIRIC
ncbi:hypothetical protein Pint_26646 [Pistacia integerrima]|uniref:Uncharacterized protein n=1 Tax=Pistacia integerrima TaxID=434235 RepID=A0ACC0YUP9_9ROSI|nr:hypothetical protein Pint_26646 [Pistacia integerrima]